MKRYDFNLLCVLAEGPVMRYPSQSYIRLVEKGLIERVDIPRTPGQIKMELTDRGIRLLNSWREYGLQGLTMLENSTEQMLRIINGLKPAGEGSHDWRECPAEYIEPVMRFVPSDLIEWQSGRARVRLTDRGRAAL